MRNVIIFFVVFVALTIKVNCEELELDTDLMHAIEDSNKSLASNIALKDAKASTSDSKDLDDMFDKVQTFFVTKGDADNAVDLAKKSRDLTAAIIKSVGENDFDSASISATALSRTCRTCHTFYKKD